MRGTPDWLSPEEAADIPFAGLARQATPLPPGAGRRPGRRHRHPAAGRRKRLLIADMDSTIVTGETLDEIAAFAGLKDADRRDHPRAR